MKRLSEANCSKGLKNQMDPQNINEHVIRFLAERFFVTATRPKPALLFFFSTRQQMTKMCPSFEKTKETTGQKIEKSKRQSSGKTDEYKKSIVNNRKMFDKKKKKLI
jgi:hypothetical protein